MLAIPFVLDHPLLGRSDLVIKGDCLDSQAIANALAVHLATTLSLSRLPAVVVHGQLRSGCRIKVVSELPLAAAAVVPTGAVNSQDSVTRKIELVCLATDISNSGGLRLEVIGGPDAGGGVDLSDGISIGRDPRNHLVIDDPGLSAVHATIHKTTQGYQIDDAGSLNGVFVNERNSAESSLLKASDLVRIGMSTLQVRSGTCGAHHQAVVGEAGFVDVLRPPRAVVSPENQGLVIPRMPEPTLGRTPFRLASLLVPLVFAGLMVKLTHQYTFVAFALISPMMMIANLVSDRRNNRSRAKRENQRFKAELALFGAELSVASAQARIDAIRVPDVATMCDWAAIGSGQLWERRPRHPDFGLVVLGRGEGEWQPMIENPRDRRSPEVAELLHRHGGLGEVPISLRIEPATVAGVCGARKTAEGVLRSIISQLCAAQGPADLSIYCCAEPERLASWQWLKWLPHFEPTGEFAPFMSNVEDLSSFATELSGSSGPRLTRPLSLLIVDIEPRNFARMSSINSWNLLRNRLAVLLIAPSAGLLPSAVNTIVEEKNFVGRLRRIEVPSAAGTNSSPQIQTSSNEILLDSVTLATSQLLARNLSRFKDPESSSSLQSIPEIVSVLHTLGLDNSRGSFAEQTVDTWRSNGSKARALLGCGRFGPIVVDLDSDGPHGLIGGTTGAGKSELQRSIIASLALTTSPQLLNFILVDYKGGSAFDKCAELPHTVGLITDLDQATARRAIVALEAELRNREAVLRSAGASDIGAYWKSSKRIRSDATSEAHSEPDSESGSQPSSVVLARLVVVVDEFATLKSELPDFVDALVDIAQRGRSLGVHLLLATQRPAGVVNDVVRANTEYKIALRMQESSDSVDILGASDAAFLPRSQKGLGLVKFGQEGHQKFRAAYCSGRMEESAERVSIEPFDLSCSESGQIVGKHSTNSELHEIVKMCRDAFHLLGSPMIRRPWPDPLDPGLLLSSIRDVPGPSGVASPAPATERRAVSIAVGVVDDPATQCQSQLAWAPSRSNLLLYGIDAIELSQTLLAIGASACWQYRPSEVHLYAVAAGNRSASGLDSLRRQPNTGAVVHISERERLVRLVNMLSKELASRSTAGAGGDRVGRDLLGRDLASSDFEIGDLDLGDLEIRNQAQPGERKHHDPVDLSPAILLLLDSIGALKSELEDHSQLNGPWEQLMRILTEGPRHGIYTAVAIDRMGLVSGPIASAFEQRWVFKCADRLDYSQLGFRAVDTPKLLERQAIAIPGGLVCQVAKPDERALEARSKGEVVVGLPAAVEALPVIVSRPTTASADFAQRPWVVPVGLRESDVSTARLSIHAGEHVLVCGGPRAGRTTVLVNALASFLAERSNCGSSRGNRHIALGRRVFVVAPPRSPFHNWRPQLENSDSVAFVSVAELSKVELSKGGSGPVTLVLIDDAEMIDDFEGTMAGLIASENESLIVVASVRPEVIRSNYAHWTRQIRRSRLAILLRPSEIDIEFAGVQIPKRMVPTQQGRGILVQDGGLEVVQFWSAPDEVLPFSSGPRKPRSPTSATSLSLAKSKGRPAKKQPAVTC